MLERLLVLIAILLSVILLYVVAQFLIFKRRAARGLGLDRYQLGRPAILYFTAPGCVPCRTIQQPALNLIMDEFGDRVQIFKVDAVENQQLANQWAVLSVPTTFLIDSLGRPRGVNNRAVTSEILIDQLKALGENLEKAPSATSGIIKVESS